MAHSNAFYGQGTGDIALENVECSGSESQLLACSSNTIFDTSCSHSEDAGVKCEGVFIDKVILYIVYIIYIHRRVVNDCEIITERYLQVFPTKHYDNAHAPTDNPTHTHINFRSPDIRMGEF